MQMLSDPQLGIVAENVVFLGLTATPLAVNRLEQVPQQMTLLSQRLGNARVVTCPESMQRALRRGRLRVEIGGFLPLQNASASEHAFWNIGSAAALRLDPKAALPGDAQHTSWKLDCLMLHFSPGSFEQAIVFVQRRDTAHQLAWELRLRGLSAQSLVGVTAKARQKNADGQYGADEAEIRNQLDVFAAFSGKQFEVLVATAAAEEGIDVPEVDLVVAYDGCVSLRSFVQAKGRCRAQKSHFVVFCDGQSAAAKVDTFAKLEEDIVQWILLESTDYLESPHFHFEEKGTMYREAYTVESTRAKVDEKGAVALLYQVCQSLCAEDLPQLDCTEVGEKRFVATLLLGNIFPFQLRSYNSPAFARKSDGRRFVCMQALKKLHKAGWMSDNLFPLKVTETAELDELKGAPAPPPLLLQLGDSKLISCRVLLEVDSPKLEVCFWIRIPRHLVVNEFETEFSNGFSNSRLRLEADEKGSDGLSFINIRDVPFPLCISSVSLLQEDARFLRRYAIDGRTVLLIDASETASCAFPDAGKASSFVEYFSKVHSVAIFPHERLWRVARVLSRFKPGKPFKQIYLLPESLVAENLAEELAACLVKHSLPELLHRMQQEAHLRIACRRLQRTLSPHCLIPASRDAEKNLEKLECVGDTVLKLLVSKWLFIRHPYPESLLSDLRSCLTSNARLAAIFQRLDLIVDPRNVASFWSWSRNEAVVSQKCCADIVEAIIGSVYSETGSEDAVERCLQFCTETLRLFEHSLLPTAVWRREPVTDADVGHLPPAFAAQFREKALLLEALTHSSMQGSRVQNYNRLEFLGDAVLDLCVVSRLAHLFPDASPAQLTGGKSCLVSTQTLARIARHHNLPSFVAHQISDLPTESSSAPETVPGFEVWLGNEPKLFADIVEAIVGAYYVDCDFDFGATTAFVERLCMPVWEGLFSNPFVPEPVDLLHQLLPNSELHWSEAERALVINGYEVSRMLTHCSNWKRTVAARACAMLRANTSLHAALKKKK